MQCQIFPGTHERRVFVQQTPSEQILEAVLAPSVERVEPQKPKAPESARPVEIYDYLRIKERPPPPVEELPRRRREQVDPRQFQPSAPQRFEPFDPRDPRNRQQPPFDPRDPRAAQFHDPRDPRLQDPRRQGRPIPVDQSGRPIQPKKIPLDQYDPHVDARYPGKEASCILFN
ncbi:unnamed protein product [Strongylus vulgaris]|uniref:Uncharacterized protein n=1 Tax=Strongylus vulgaris TaxID=40348 RepID=A0A3P7JL90_STRVU|nr:unnamed protein product [Strongylus vulgaris]